MKLNAKSMKFNNRLSLIVCQCNVHGVRLQQGLTCIEMKFYSGMQVKCMATFDKY